MRGRRKSEANAPPTDASTTVTIIPKKKVNASPHWSEQVVDTGLNLRVGGVDSELLRDCHDLIDVFLLGMKNKDLDRDQ